MTLIDTLFKRPAITITDAALRLSVTCNAAAKIVEKLVDLEVLTELSGFYPKTYIARGVMRAAKSDSSPPEPQCPADSTGSTPLRAS